MGFLREYLDYGSREGIFLILGLGFVFSFSVRNLEIEDWCEILVIVRLYYVCIWFRWILKYWWKDKREDGNLNSV